MVLYLFVMLLAADWLNEGGDARRRNVQPLERAITPARVGGLKLIWKQKLGDGAGLSSPVIMGRLITYRGTVELVFVAAADGRVYAVDGDFGKIFWTRRLEVGAARCGAVATPGLAPIAPGVDPDEDVEQPTRPLFVVSADGVLQGLNPVDGKDVGAARRVGCVDGLVVKKGRAVGFRRGALRPLVAGGVAFRLVPETGELVGVEAGTGRELFRGEAVGATSSALAVANGHVCFSASATLYCYGFPEEH